MRFAPACLAALGLGACGAPATSPESLARAVEAGAPQALYSEFPTDLFAFHAEVCARPGETVVQPSPREVRCEILLPPEMTGGIILQFNGTVEDLPKLVMALIAQPSDDGYVVTSDSYLRIPQQDGRVRLVRLPNDETRASIRELFEVSGGTPL